MSAKIKFNIFNILFRLFSFLADKTNGWGVFVKPKLLFGSLIMGLSISVYAAENTPESKSETTRTLIDKIEVSCYLPAPLPVKEEVYEEVYIVVEEPPAFPEGDEALKDFINKEMKYPSVAYENGIQGRVYCRFIIEKDGTISDIVVVRSVDPWLDKEAVRVIKAMPQWTPGKIKGEPVRMQFTLPIRFILR